MSSLLSQTAWPSVICGPSRPKRSMYSTAVPPPRRRAYSFWYAVSNRWICKRHIVFARAIGELRQRLIGAPMQVGRSELNLDPAVVAVPAVKPLEQRDVIVERQLKTLEPSLHRAAQFGRQAGDEILVPLVDQPVLVAHRVRDVRSLADTTGTQKA